MDNKKEDLLGKITGDELVDRRSIYIKIYNEQLDQLIRAELDVELFEGSLIGSPNDTQLARTLAEAKQRKEIKSKLIKALEERLLSDGENV